MGKIIQRYLDDEKTVKEYDVTVSDAVLMPDGRKLTAHMGEINEAVKKLNELFGEGVEGYVRVSGVSDPAFNYRSFKHDVGHESVFDCLKPCLVGNNYTGRCGELLAVLNPTDWYHDEYGNEVLLDGTQGEVMVCNTRTIYAISGKVAVGAVTYDVFLRSYAPFDWNGHAADAIEPMGWSPSYTVAHADDDGTMRMHSCYNPEWDGSYQAQHGMVGRFVQSQDEDGNITEVYDADAAWFGSAGGLHTTNLPLYTGEKYAMNLNNDKTKPVPFYNRTAAGEEIFMGNILAEGGTWDAHRASLMGSGFCANDIASAEAHWNEDATEARNGFRYVKQNGAYGYYGLNSNADFGYGASGDNLYKACMINSWRSPWSCLEQQRVMMYAIEHNVPELSWFVFEGNKYKWRHVNGFAGPSEGALTCVVWKHVSSKLVSGAKEPGTSHDVSGNRCEFLICSSLYHGVITDVSPSWWTSGLIFTEDENGQYEAYMQRSQSHLIVSENGDKSVGDKFSFEQQYHHVGTFANGSGYRKDYSNDAIMLPANDGVKSGASLHTYVCGNNYFIGTKAGAGKKSVRGFRRGCYAGNTLLSPLSVYAGVAPSASLANYAFGTCVTLTKPERSV